MDDFSLGNLTGDIALLSGNDMSTAVAEPDSSTAAESTDGAIQPAEREPRDINKSLPDSSRLVPASQSYQSPADQETAAVHDELTKFCDEVIVEALPSWTGDHEKARLTGQVNAEIFRHIGNDKSFMRALNKTYDGSRQALQRGAELLVERWLEELPYAIQNLNMPKPLTQDEADSMDDLAVLSSSRPVQRRPAKSPLRGVVRQ